MSEKKGIHHRASDPEKKKGGSPRWWCILFSSLLEVSNRRSQFAAIRIAVSSGALQKGPPFHGSRGSREKKIRNASCQMGVVAKLLRDKTASFCREMSGREVTPREKSASQSSMELYYPWISGPLRVS